MYALNVCSSVVQIVRDSKQQQSNISFFHQPPTFTIFKAHARQYIDIHFHCKNRSTCSNPLRHHTSKSFLYQSSDLFIGISFVFYCLGSASVTRINEFLLLIVRFLLSFIDIRCFLLLLQQLLEAHDPCTLKR
jgi:hypothetical protein